MQHRVTQALAALSCVFGASLLLEAVSQHPLSQQRVLGWGLVGICLYIPAQRISGVDPPRLRMRTKWQSWERWELRQGLAGLLALLPLLVLAGWFDFPHIITAIFSSFGVWLIYDLIRALSGAHGW